MLAHLKLAIACLGLWLRFAIEVGVLQVMLVLLLYVVQPLLGCEQAWTPSFNLMSFDMDSFSHPQQGRIDFNTVNPSLSRGMDFLIHPCR